MKRYLLLLTLLQIFTRSAFGFEAHEWGTFTSLVDSNGKTQNGMHHEDEVLPDFVHGFGETQFVFNPPNPPDGECPTFSKFCFFPNTLENNIISQKMETPVIYFYGDQAQRVQVDVNFPEGIITETYPAPVLSSPKNSEDLVIADGHAQFLVDLMPNSTLTPTPVPAGNIYGHARNTDSLLLRTNNEIEKFIFYRGIGRFQPQFDIQSDSSSLSLRIHQNHLPQSAFLVYVEENEPARLIPLIGSHSLLNSRSDNQGYYYYHIGEKIIQQLKAGQGLGIVDSQLAKESLVQALVRSGLFTDEALAMVNTWENGYFKTPGLRLLYILPKHEVDSILPITFSPAPQTLQRSFVARIEVMLEDEEVELVQKILAEQNSFDIKSLGRFAEPRLRRAREVYRDGVVVQSPIQQLFPNGHFALFDELVEQSIVAEPIPLVVD